MKRSYNNVKNVSNTLAQKKRTLIYDMLTELISLCFRESPRDDDYYDFDLKELHDNAISIFDSDKQTYEEFVKDLHSIRNYIQSKKNKNRIDSEKDMNEHFLEWDVVLQHTNLPRNTIKQNSSKSNNINVQESVISSNVDSLSDRIGKISIKNSAPVKKIRKLPRSLR